MPVSSAAPASMGYYSGSSNAYQTAYAYPPSPVQASQPISYAQNAPQHHYATTQHSAQYPQPHPVHSHYTHNQVQTYPTVVQDAYAQAQYSPYGGYHAAQSPVGYP
eukprot:CAMPEP_0178715302 /NCGR_PEP_ID=MMETSP0699-20121125/20577_1 /TAXON_ID=265572 /ORGANISM="Extubocellulus spinifer, Strain CCMP396" /LENGTH=105 /DNA_ID=CAMNT_0020364579 /DNA_START=575 /DNA_END=888 /DNA_ORIENTATION=-